MEEQKMKSVSAAIQEALEKVEFTIRYVGGKVNLPSSYELKLSGAANGSERSNDTRQNKMQFL